jgi:hypothetical protein
VEGTTLPIAFIGAPSSDFTMFLKIRSNLASNQAAERKLREGDGQSKRPSWNNHDGLLPKQEW